MVPEQERTEWYCAAKFGMFIHWGPYSLASVEASWPIMVPKPGGITEAEYLALPERFNPTKFDPDAWIDLARDRRAAIHGLHNEAPRRVLHVRLVVHGL